MSVINQMLRDLQQQKKDAEKANQGPSSFRKVARAPLLPLPLVMGGGTLALLFFAWWLSGALSETMPDLGTSAKPEVARAIVAAGREPATGKIMAAAEFDQLTKTERETEIPVSTAAADPVVEKKPDVISQQTVSVTPAEKTPAIKPAAGKATSVTNSSGPTATIPRQVKGSSGESATTTPVQNSPEHIPAKVEASPQKSLHPDALPGAIMSSSQNLVETNNTERPSRAQATTPYGMAEEAYLDGKWALGQGRSSLAVKYLQEALTLYPGHLQARGMLVEMYVKEGKAGEAMFLLAEGLEIAPDYIVFKKKYSRLLMDQGDFDAAIKVIMNGGMPAVQADPEAHMLLASLYQRLGEPFLAAQTYRNLLVVWPQRGAFWVGLGGALEEQRLSAEAVVCYQKALKTKDLSPDLKHSTEKRLSLLN